MKSLVAFLLTWNRCVVLASVAIWAAVAQSWTVGMACVVFLASVVAGLIPFKREIVLAVLLGMIIPWGYAFLTMVPLVFLLEYLEVLGRRMMQRLEDQQQAARSQ